MLSQTHPGATAVTNIFQARGMHYKHGKAHLPGARRNNQLVRHV